MSAPTAAWPADSLVAALARAGWGALDGRRWGGCRAALRALVDLLPHGAAQGKITRAQVADAAGLSPKWAGTCLARLEAMGLITYERGWLKDGKPMPGRVRVNKTMLAEWVRCERRGTKLARHRQTRADAMRERLKGLRLLTQRPVTPCQSDGNSVPPLPSIGRDHGLPARVPPPRKTTTMLCIHGFAGSCPQCHKPPTPPAEDTTTKCHACRRSKAGHDKVNALVPPGARHEWVPA